MMIKAIVTISSQVFMLFTVFLLTPKIGINALGIAQIAQGAIAMILSWLCVRKVLDYKICIPFRFDNSIFKELFKFGFNVQIGSFVMLMFDPLTKILFAKFGGASFAGLFEVASQIIIRARAFIITANQVVIPKIATVFEESPIYLKELYKKNMFFLIPVITMLYLCLFVWSNLIVKLIFGHNDENFNLIFYSLIFSWSINTLSAPAYFFNLGSGDAKKNAFIHICMAFINIIFGPLLGFFIGWKGVLAAYIFSLVFASLLTIYKFHFDYGINVKFLEISKRKNILVFNFIALVIVSLVKFFDNLDNFLVPYAFEVLATFLILYINFSNQILFEFKKSFNLNFKK